MSLADSLRDWQPGTAEMAFVAIRTELVCDGVPAVVEEQDIVYRSARRHPGVAGGEGHAQVTRNRPLGG